MKHNQTHQRIAEFIREHPEMTFQSIASKLGISIPTLSHIAKEFGLSRPVTIQLNEDAFAGTKGKK
jgi:DNA-binding MurR/RpiR family transcriptional regulator